MSTFTYVTALIVAGGGLAGYAKKKSVPSLVAGLASGALLGYSGYAISQGDDKGHVYALGECTGYCRIQTQQNQLFFFVE